MGLLALHASGVQGTVHRLQELCAQTLVRCRLPGARVIPDGNRRPWVGVLKSDHALLGNGLDAKAYQLGMKSNSGHRGWLF